MLSEVWNVSTLIILLKNWKMCVSRSRCSVGSQRRISNKGWHHKGPNRELNVSYVVRGSWNYLNVRVHLSSRYWVKLFDFNLQRFFLHHCPRCSSQPMFVFKRQESLLLYPGESLSGRCWNSFPPKQQKNSKAVTSTWQFHSQICIEVEKPKKATGGSGARQKQDNNSTMDLKKRPKVMLSLKELNIESRQKYKMLWTLLVVGTEGRSMLPTHGIYAKPTFPNLSYCTSIELVL